MEYLILSFFDCAVVVKIDYWADIEEITFILKDDDKSHLKNFIKNRAICICTTQEKLNKQEVVYELAYKRVLNLSGDNDYMCVNYYNDQIFLKDIC